MLKGSWWMFRHDKEHPSIFGHLMREYGTHCITQTTVWFASSSRRPTCFHGIPRVHWSPQGNADDYITLEVADSTSLKSCLPSWRMSSSWEKWSVTLLYPLLSPQCLLTRRTSHLESPHSDCVTIHGHHFLKDKCLQKVPFILLSELHCLLPSRDPKVEE